MFMEKIRNYVGNKTIVAYTLVTMAMPFVSGCFLTGSKKDDGGSAILPSLSDLSPSGGSSTPAINTTPPASPYTPPAPSVPYTPPAPSTPAAPSAPAPKIYSGEREIGEKAIELLRKKYPNFAYFTGKTPEKYENIRDLEMSVDDTSGNTRDFSPDYFDATNMVGIEVNDNSGNIGYDPSPSWLPQEKHIIWVIPNNITEQDLEARL